MRFDADQNWDRGGYSVYTNAAGEISKPCTMSGMRAVSLSGDHLREND